MFCPFPGEARLFGLTVEFVGAAANDEEEGVVAGVVADAASEAALAGDGLIEEPGLEGEQFDEPLFEEEVMDEVGAFDGVFDGGGAGLDEVRDAGFPRGRDEEFAGVDVVFAGVAGDFLLAGGGAGSFGEASVGAAGGEFLFGHAD